MGDPLGSPRVAPLFWPVVVIFGGRRAYTFVFLFLMPGRGGTVGPGRGRQYSHGFP